MAFWRTFSWILLIHVAVGLQATPGGPCASVCLDDSSAAVSDPYSSNTNGSQIVCSDSSYSSQTGSRFQSCVTCLQNSTASDLNGNDQSWFLYNMRYALDTCLFGFENASQPISTPCSTSLSCGPLQQALEDGNLIPVNETTYGYCQADGNAFLGSFLSKCTTCLQDGGNENYLANFLIALQAGCVQQPPVGTRIGIQGSVFSQNSVNITWPGYGSTTPSKRLSQGVIIALSVTFSVLGVALVISIILYLVRKHRHTSILQRLKSPLDSRFGAANITSPNDGAFGNPYSKNRVKISGPIDTSNLSNQELQALGLIAPSKEHSHVQVSDFNNYQNTDALIPTHEAYIPPTRRSYHAYEPSSPVTSIATDDSYRNSTCEPDHAHSVNLGPRPQETRSEHLPNIPPRNNLRSPQPPQRQQQSPAFSIKRSSPPPSVDTRSLPRYPHSESRNGGAMSSAVSPVVSPIQQFNSPLVNQGRRLDFELAEREHMHREHIQREGETRRRNPDVDPQSLVSAASEEQWPGTY